MAAAAAISFIKLVIVVFVGRYKKNRFSSTRSRFDARVVTTYLLSSLAGRASRVIIKKRHLLVNLLSSLLSYFSKRSSVCSDRAWRAGGK